MTRTEARRQYHGAKAIGVIYVSGPQSIEIIATETGIEDYVIFRWVDSCKGAPQKNKLRYNKNGEAYFISYRMRFYLKDAVRIN